MAWIGSSIVTFFFSYSLKQPPARNKLFKKKSVGNIQEKSSKKLKDESDSEVYGNLDASKTILLHGLESDFIEEQMSEDKEFRFNLTSHGGLKVNENGPWLTRTKMMT